MGPSLGLEPTFGLMAFGIVASLGMDLDMVIYYVRNRGRIDQFAHEHRDLFHHPIFYSLVGGAVWWLVLGKAYCVIWVIGSLFHFVHDTYEGGWGVRWLSPFNDWYFTLVTYSPVKVIKTKTRQRELAARYGNPDWQAEGRKVSIRLVVEIIMLVGVLCAAIERINR